MKLFDQHVHTHFSQDSTESLQNYIDKAIELGVDTLVFTNHIDYDYVTYNNNWVVDFDKELEEIKEYRKKYSNMKIYQGVEFGYTASRVKEINELIKNNQFNVINYSMHYSYGIDYYVQDEFKKKGIKETVLLYLKSVIEMLDAPIDFDVLCHVDYGFKTAHLIDSSLVLSEFEEELKIIFNKLIKLDKCLEINTKVQEAINDDSNVLYLLKLYKECGGKHLTLSSDAHRVDRLCSSFDKYLQIIKDAGFDELNYFVERKRYTYYI